MSRGHDGWLELKRGSGDSEYADLKTVLEVDLPLGLNAEGTMTESHRT